MAGSTNLDTLSPVELQVIQGIRRGRHPVDAAQGWMLPAVVRDAMGPAVLPPPGPAPGPPWRRVGLRGRERKGQLLQRDRRPFGLVTRESERLASRGQFAPQPGVFSCEGRRAVGVGGGRRAYARLGRWGPEELVIDALGVPTRAWASPDTSTSQRYGGAVDRVRVAGQAADQAASSSTDRSTARTVEWVPARPTLCRRHLRLCQLVSDARVPRRSVPARPQEDVPGVPAGGL